MASSFDTVGPITKSVTDAKIIQEIIAGQDFLDATTVEVKNKKLKVKNKKLKVGIPQEYFEIEGIDEEVKKIIENKIKEISKNKDLEIVSVSLPMTKYAIPVYYIIVSSEDSSNLARIDAIRYGERKEGSDLYNVYAQSRAEGMNEEVKRRIMIGTCALSADYYDISFRKAQKVRTLIIQDFEKVFQEVDLLITPTTPTPAFKLGEKKDDILSMYLADIFVSPAAVAGLPAISIPVGLTKKKLPVGMQIIGSRLEDEKLLSFSNLIINY